MKANNSALGRFEELCERVRKFDEGLSDALVFALADMDREAIAVRDRTATEIIRDLDKRRLEPRQMHDLIRHQAMVDMREAERLYRRARELFLEIPRDLTECISN